MIKNDDKIICLAGKNEIAIYGLNLLLERIDKRNVRILCNSTDIGVDTWQPSLLKAARKNNISVISVEDCYNINDLIFLSLEFDKLIVPSKFSNAHLFNIHFSNLPCYKGMFTSAIPLLNRESEAGVTLHEIDAGIDTGNIIDQLNFQIYDTDNCRDLYFKYLHHSKKMLEANLDKILRGTTNSTSQPSLGSTYYSAKAIDYTNLKVNLFASAEQIRNQIRAYTFPEYQVPRVHGYFVNSAIVKKIKSTKKPGNLLSVNSTELSISTIDYDLTLYRDKDSELFEDSKTNDKDSANECIEYGANVNARKGNGWTPTIVAAFNGSKDVLRLLIDNGADVNLTNYKGTTPLMYAMAYYESSGQRYLFDLLLESGAKLELVDVNQKSIYDFAKERNVSGLF
jgi:methionyl-tRNA formyltransferase